MPVVRYRSIEAVPPPEARDPRASGFLDRLDDVWQGATHGLPALFGPGVRRYRSVVEADRDRELALIARMRAMRNSSAPGPRRPSGR
jgi:hypothetical protein